jgi:hypothetical protein
MARLVVEYVTGAQDNAPGAKAGPDGKHMLIGMCCKHFAGVLFHSLLLLGALFRLQENLFVFFCLFFCRSDMIVV